MGWLSFLFGRSATSRDGSSAEKAVIVRSVAGEYDWLRLNFPGFTMELQSLFHIGSKHYDVMRIRTAQGQLKEIYFDISGFFGR
jgi:hypothetical protein